MPKVEMVDLMTLTDNIVSDDINEYSITLYGEGGSGKSTFANALKRKLGSSASFFFEPRAKGLGGIKVVECPTWGVFLSYIRQLKKLSKEGKSVPFNNIIIDSCDSAYARCTKYVMEENDWDTLQGDYGSRYTAVGTSFKDAINELRNLGFIVTFLTHETSTEAHDVNNAAFEKAVPIVSNQIKDIVNDQVDFILYLSKVTVTDDDGNKKEMRRLWFKNNPYMALKTPLFGMPDYIEYEYVNEGVDKFIEAFNKGVKITRDMHDNGEDISNPNFENELVVEFVSPKVGNDIDDDFVEEANDSSELSLEELHNKAIEIRDTLLNTMEREEVIALLNEKLGTAAIKKCKDIDKLKDFVSSYK